MNFTVIGYDTHEAVEIYDTVEANDIEGALQVIRKNWPRSNQLIFAIYEDEPENLYDPDADPVNDDDYDDDYTEDELEEDENNDYDDD